MARIIRTQDFDPDTLDPQLVYQAYNALDCCITLEVRNELEPMLDPVRRLTYEFEFGMQAPALDMMRRGILVDQHELTKLVNELKLKKQRVEYVLDTLARAVWGQGLNHNSPKQLQQFFYGALRCPPQTAFTKGEKKISTNRECLEKLSELDADARIFVTTILKARDIDKKLSVLATSVGADGRFRFGVNVGGTETGRWSISKNPFGEGSNSQNITEDLRRIFVSDRGKKLAYIDLEQAESRIVAYRSGDERLIAACESGDLHTYCARIIWTDSFPWTGDLKKDREYADLPFYRWFSHRDMSKRGGHATNYYGKPFTVSRHLKIPIRVAEMFRSKYLSTFPGIPDWWRWVAEQLQTQGFLVTALGRKRIFFGRLNDEATLREAIAFEPQSMVGETLNIGLHRLFRHRRELGLELLNQVHDAALIQYPEDAEDEVIEAAQMLMQIPLTIRGREFTIPVESKVGYVWNKDHMLKWKGHGSTRSQVRRPAAPSEMPLLDRVFY